MNYRCRQASKSEHVRKFICSKSRSRNCCLLRVLDPAISHLATIYTDYWSLCNQQQLYTKLLNESNFNQISTTEFEKKMSLKIVSIRCHQDNRLYWAGNNGFDWISITSTVFEDLISWLYGPLSCIRATRRLNLAKVYCSACNAFVLKADTAIKYMS